MVLVSLFFMICPKHVYAQINGSAKTEIDTSALNAAYIMVGDTSSEQTQPKYYREYGQSMNGMIIPDDEDSTILMLTCGNYSRDSSGNYSANGGAMLYNNNEQVVITTDRLYDDDSTRVIYDRGQMSSTTCCHDTYTEDAVILHRVDSGWQVSDSREAQFVPDFRSLVYLGTYGGRYYLMRRETQGVYAGGHEEGNQDYFMISRDSLNGPHIDLEVSSSDEATGLCDTGLNGWDHSRDCSCHNDNGSATFGYDSTLDCIVVRLTYTSVTYQCMHTNPQTTRTTQVWYMNEDTALLAADYDSIANGEDKTGHVKLIWKKADRKARNLSRKKIERALGNTGKHKRYGFIKSSFSTESFFNER
jgi:hypothetical protein